jgi:hypothetical protein
MQVVYALPLMNPYIHRNILNKAVDLPSSGVGTATAQANKLK